MAKDSGGHGSDSRLSAHKAKMVADSNAAVARDTELRNLGWNHQKHWAEAQRLLKERADHIRAGRGRQGADTMVRAREHAEMANHLRTSELLKNRRPRNT